MLWCRIGSILTGWCAKNSYGWRVPSEWPRISTTSNSYNVVNSHTWSFQKNSKQKQKQNSWNVLVRIFIFSSFPWIYFAFVDNFFLANNLVFSFSIPLFLTHSFKNKPHCSTGNVARFSKNQTNYNHKYITVCNVRFISLYRTIW